MDDATLAQAILDAAEAPDDGHTFTYEVETEGDDDPLFLAVPADAVPDMLDAGYRQFLATMEMTP